MPISRRHFLRAGAVTVAAAGAPASINALAAGLSARDKATARTDGARALMTKAMFAPHLRTTFNVLMPRGQKLRVELVELSDCGQADRRASEECFALTFRAPAHRALGQNTYRLEHAKLGEFDLFIAPVRGDKHGQAYEAIVNHARA